MDENNLLIDTYEDENKYRNLYIYSLSNDNLNKIGKFYSEYNDVGYRCDLHPRLCKKENNEFIISIDCCSSIKRHMELIKLRLMVGNFHIVDVLYRDNEDYILKIIDKNYGLIAAKYLN